MEPHYHPILDIDIVTLLLRRVERKQRLRSCALVCSTWQKAAEKATNRVEAHVDTAKKADAFTRWLKSHSNQTSITDLEVSAPLSDLWLQRPLTEVQAQPQTLLLPVSKLQGLQNMSLSGVGWRLDTAAASTSSPVSPWQAQLQAAGALTSLTRVRLRDIAARDTIDSLAALTGLADLETCTAPAVNAALKDALPKLRQLTRLALSADPTRVCGCQACNGYQLWTAPFSHLTQLQSLSLARPNLSLSSFDVLPTTLTSLEVVEALYQPGHSISLLRTPSICRLPALQQLKLYGVTIDMSALALLMTLKDLSINASGLFTSSGDPQLQTISMLTNLRSLHLRELWRRQDDSTADAIHLPERHPVSKIELSTAEAAAVTASTCLSRLVLGEGVALNSTELMCSMFPTSHSLPHLKILDTYSMGLLISKATAEQVVNCCPNLQCVRVRTGSCNFERAPCELQLADSLRALSSISGTLTELTMGCPELTLPQAGWQALAALTGLQYLQLNCLATAIEGVLELTACRSLQHLLLHVVEPDTNDGLILPWDWSIIGDHGLHKGKTDVWCQLPLALLTRVVQAGGPHDMSATLSCKEQHSVETTAQVAAMSALVRSIIQMQRKQQRDLAVAQKQLLAAQMHKHELELQLDDAQHALRQQKRQQQQRQQQQQAAAPPQPVAMEGRQQQ